MNKKKYDLLIKLSEKMQQTLLNDRKNFQEQGKTLWEAWADFTRESLELEPEIVISSLFPPLVDSIKADFNEDTPVTQN